MTEAKIVQTKASFNVCVENVSKLTDFYSPQVVVQGIPWIFSFTKRNFGEQRWLTVVLYCRKGGKSRDWVIPASSTIELISSRGIPHTIEKESAPYTFDYTGRGYGHPNFIKWEDLIDIEKGYVENDAIRFNIKVKVDDPDDKRASKLQVDFSKCCDESSHTTLKLTVNNIDELMAVRTGEFMLKNVPWTLTVFKSSVNGLGLRLWNELYTSATTFKAKIDVTIKSTIRGVRDIEATASTFQQCFIMNSIISWDELFRPENGFIVNNSVAFEVKIKVDNVKVAAPNSNKRNASTLEIECPICFETMNDQDLSSTDCGHMFCSECIKKVVSADKPCPSCNTKLNLSKVRRLYLPFAKKD